MGYETLILLPIGLGLLGFIEPCTIGAHMLFLKSIDQDSNAAKRRAILIFILTRGLITGLIGIAFVLLGRNLVGAQTLLWTIFGSLYLAIGLAYLTGWHRMFTKRITFAPERWRQAKSPAVLGVAFGLNIPACAAPLVFGLFSVTAGTGTLQTGFVMMGLFGLALSVPLVVLEYAGWRDSRFLVYLQSNPLRLKYILAGVFILLGLWSIWFGLNVDPEDWSGI